MIAPDFHFGRNTTVGRRFVPAPKGGFALAPTHGYSDKGFLRNRRRESPRGMRESPRGIINGHNKVCVSTK